MTRLAQLYRCLSTDAQAAAESQTVTGGNSLTAVVDVPPDAEDGVAAGDPWVAGAVGTDRTGRACGLRSIDWLVVTGVRTTCQTV